MFKFFDRVLDLMDRGFDQGKEDKTSSRGLFTDKEARRAGQRRQHDDQHALVGKIDQSNPDWADFD